MIRFKKGKHLSSQFPKLRFGLWNNGQVICKVKFTDSCRYNLGGEDQLDWNKLAAGAAWGFFPLVKQYMAHQNSSRWGWRYNPTIDKIELTPYFYNNGVRNYAETLGIEAAKLDINKEYLLCIVPFINPVNDKQLCAYSISNAQAENIFTEDFEQIVPSKRGWLLPAYFGGTKAAPQYLHYELTYL